MQPHIQFKLNKPLDKKMALTFLNVNAGGVNFSNGIIGVHPELKKIKKKKKADQKNMVDQHFDNFYQKHKDYLNKIVKEFQTDWNKVEKKYFQTVAKFFKNYNWPKGKYIGYLSIIDCNPRFIKDKSFQVFYLHPKGVVSVTAHELLHFIFYDYCLKRHFKIFKSLNTNEGLFWDLAEIFNAVILSQPEFIKIHKIKKQLCYPEHKKYIAVLKKYWNKEKNIDKWIIKSFNYLNKKTKTAVSAFIIKDGKFLLLERCNPPIKWCPPCGRVHKGETFNEAVIRESKEESNVDIKVLMPITFWAGQHGDESLTSIGFLCEYVSGDLKVSEEHSNAKWLTLEELKNEELTHEVKDFIKAEKIKKLFDNNEIE